MPPGKDSLDLACLRQAWMRFIESGQMPPEIDPLVAVAWQRCAPRLNPYAPPQWISLKEEVLALTLRQLEGVLGIARPILEDVYQFIEGAGVMLAFVDSTACLLESLGDPPVLEAMGRLGFRRGVFLHEGHVGSNAFASALVDSSPAQFVGAQHFLSELHGLSTAAAPLFDLAGHTVGAVGVLTTVAGHNPHAVGIAVAAARAIENQMQADLVTGEANARATELNATLDAVSEGVLAWDAQGILTHLNAQAGKLLGLKPASVVGRRLAEHITLPEALAHALARGEELNDLETGLGVDGQPRECLISLRVICLPNGEPAAFIATLRRIEQVRRLVHQLVGAQARLTLDDIVGQSALARRVRRQAVAAADAKASVLLQGESGTGKSALARAIHNSSHRANGPFLAINCRAVPRELVLGEFLGFEAGAFNSRHSSGQPSKFELAQGGTLYLEEVEALPLDMQAALLRVIEAGDVIRLGGTRVIPVDARLIASTHAPLEERVAEGAFRADLLFRLSSFLITMPPLRERPEDIPPLLERRLERLSAQLGRATRLTAEARAALIAYPWPGNIRELESALERAALSCDGAPIALEHLPAAVRERRAILPGKPITEPVRSLAEAEKSAILSAFRAARGNVTQTANLLGIGRTTLWRKMKEFNLTMDDFSPS